MNTYSEKFTNNSGSITESNISDYIYKVYKVDVKAIQNLADIATQLQKNGLIIPGSVTIKDNLTVNNVTTVDNKFSVNNATINNLVVNGTATFDTVNVNGDITFNGDNIYINGDNASMMLQRTDVIHLTILSNGQNIIFNLGGHFGKNRYNKEQGIFDLPWEAIRDGEVFVNL